MEEVKRAFAEHLAGLGYEVGTPPEVILRKLRERMGEERFREFESRRGLSTTYQEEFYKLFQDIVEGNLMRSLDPCATLDASFSLYQRCTSKLVRGARVLELGCWTGGLASFIAARHPQCSVVGVDFAREVVKACASFYGLPNLRFEHWNYRFGKPDGLEPADVLLCSMGVVHHLPDNTDLPDIGEVRRSHEYLRQRDHAIGYFSTWRSAANDGATLLVALRVGPFARFLAWLDAAQRVGWTPRLDRLWHVDMTGEKAPLPGLVFEARRSGPLAEDAVVDRWAWFVRRDHLYARVEGAPAIVAYRALAGRKPLASRGYRRGDGLLTHDEVGVAGGSGYVFTHDALFRFRLLLVSRERAEELAAAAVAEPASSTPIADDGWFERPAVPGWIMGGASFDAAAAGPASRAADAATGQVRSLGHVGPFATGGRLGPAWPEDEERAVRRTRAG